MPLNYWVSLEGEIRPPVEAPHVHAAISAWFDRPASAVSDAHHDTVKPYSVSPITEGPHGWGIQVGVLTEEARRRVETVGAQRPVVRFGRQSARVRSVSVDTHAPWRHLAASRSTHWKLTFLTPTTFRTKNIASPFPMPAQVLRAPTQAWERFSGLAPLSLPRESSQKVFVTGFDLRSVPVRLGREVIQGALGSITYQCHDPAIVALVAPLFALAPFCGVGSFRGKGMGVVELATAR